MQRFRLTAPTIAIEHIGCKDVAVILPEGAAILTVDAPEWNRPPNQLVPAIWEGKSIQLFLADVLERGELAGVAPGD